MLQQAPGLAALALVLLLAKDEDFHTPKGRVVDLPVLGRTQAIESFHIFKSPAGFVRLAIASAAALAIGLVVAFPMMVTLMMALRDMAR